MGVQNDFRHLAYDNDGRLGRAYTLLGPPTTAFLDRSHVLRQVVNRRGVAGRRPGSRPIGAIFQDRPQHLDPAFPGRQLQR